MFCEFCGAEMTADQRVCGKCGRERGSYRPPAASAATPAAAGAAASGAVASRALRDSWDAIRQLVVDPYGQAGPAFSRLSADRALYAGMVLCVIFAVAGALGMVASVTAVMSAFVMFAGSYGASRAELFFRGLLQMLALSAVMIGVSYLLRRGTGQKTGIGADVFLVGIALTPLGLAMLLAGLLGSLQLALLLFMIAYTFMVLLLFAGLTAIGGLSSRLAFVGVPLLIIAGAWLTQRLLGAF